MAVRNTHTPVRNVQKEINLENTHTPANIHRIVYTKYRCSCRKFTTVVVVFVIESPFYRYTSGLSGVDLKKRERYAAGSIYGPASGFVIREEWDGKQFKELQAYMRKIGSYTEEVLT